MCPSLLPTSTNRAVLQQTRRAAASRRRPFRHRTFLPNVCFARHTFSRTTNFNPGSSRYTRNSTSQLLACAASSERLAARRGNAGRAAVLGEHTLLYGLTRTTKSTSCWGCSWTAALCSSGTATTPTDNKNTTATGSQTPLTLLSARPFPPPTVGRIVAPPEPSTDSASAD